VSRRPPSSPPSPALRDRLRQHLGTSSEPARAPPSNGAEVELNGYLLQIDRAKGRLLVAFADLGLSSPVWLPAEAVRCDCAAHYGWA
jgi:hypothetical protein